jgi:hypothetical protein
MISEHLLQNGFKKVDYKDYDCMMRIHEIHFLFWSSLHNHFGIGYKNEKGDPAGNFDYWKIIMIPKPIYSIEEATKLIKAIT